MKNISHVTFTDIRISAFFKYLLSIIVTTTYVISSPKIDAEIKSETELDFYMNEQQL